MPWVVSANNIRKLQIDSEAATWKIQGALVLLYTHLTTSNFCENNIILCSLRIANLHTSKNSCCRFKIKHRIKYLGALFDWFVRYHATWLNWKHKIGSWTWKPSMRVYEISQFLIGWEQCSFIVIQCHKCNSVQICKRLLSKTLWKIMNLETKYRWLLIA